MKLSEIFGQLTSGELAQVGLGGAKTGAIAEADYHKVLNHVNLGLEDLHSRFTIRKGQLTLALQPGKATYSLSSKFAVNSRRSQELVRYVMDTPEEPFQDDIIKVERVLTDAGYEMVLNVDDDSESVSTPSTTLLRLPAVMVTGNPGDRPDYLKTSQLEVFYRATHPPIVKPIGFFDPTRVEVHLPRTYLQALLYFVAARVHNPMGMNQEFYSGTVFSSKYEQECLRLKDANVEIDTKARNTRAERGGWI